MTAEIPRWSLPPRRGGYLEGASGSARLLGIDAARGLALIGMMVAHVGITTEDFSPAGGLAGWLGLAHGRSSILFALVAGFSLGILSGRTVPHSGQRLVHTRLRILVRAAILLGAGALLELLGTPIYVILGYYATWFVLALLVLTWPVRRILLLAVGVAAIGPVLHHLLPAVLVMAGFLAPLAETGNSVPIDFLLTGAYPGVVWMAYILVGLALSRLEWDSPARIVRLLGTGVLASALGYGGSAALVSVAGPGAGRFGPEGTPMITALLLAEPHADSFFEVLGSGGFAVAAVALFLLLERGAAPILAPLITLGSMSLTVYSLHVVAYWVVGRREGFPWVEGN
nr:DUF1624 domain-containing protein [Actinomycetales bacterium]